MTSAEGKDDEPRDGQDHHAYRPVFSLLMGVIAPVLCIAHQPVLLSGIIADLPGLRFLNAYPIFNYGVVALNIVALATWLRLGSRVGKWGVGRGSQKLLIE